MILTVEGHRSTFFLKGENIIAVEYAPMNGSRRFRFQIILSGIRDFNDHPFFFIESKEEADIIFEKIKDRIKNDVDLLIVAAEEGPIDYSK